MPWRVPVIDHKLESQVTWSTPWCNISNLPFPEQCPALTESLYNIRKLMPLQTCDAGLASVSTQKRAHRLQNDVLDKPQYVHA